MIQDIEEELNHLCSLSLKPHELEYLRSIRYFKDSYIDFLRLLRLPRKAVMVGFNENDELFITIDGPWFLTIYFEVPLLAIVNEIYFRHTVKDLGKAYEVGMERLIEKIHKIQGTGVKIADFGTRRRFSADWHDKVMLEMQKYRDGFVGTSNIDLARQYDLKPIGTMAHEFICAFQALGPKIRDSQKCALQAWADEYRGDLGIALSDTLGVDAFLEDFDLYFAKLFDGARHDSGDPHKWTTKLIAHYEELGIDPKTKTAVYSDGLTVDKILEIQDRWGDKIKTAYGIGTNLTNDVGATPLNIVIKMVECNGQDVAKISDSSGKQMCRNTEYLRYLAKTFGRR
jgi:nicotinate phosphoribosyltransferase